VSSPSADHATHEGDLIAFESTPGGRSVEPLPEAIRSIQPGGGNCFRLELAWGRLRRWWLGTFRPAYVQRMRQLRRGTDQGGCPHEVLDPRDLKFYRNVCDLHWQPQDDPFRWRDQLPFARVGLAELLMIGGLCLVAAVLGLLVWAPLALAPAAVGLLVIWFFRDPPRRIPVEAGLFVAPADGRVVAIEQLDYEPHVAGPAVRIDIFLSIFNVHLNRSPAAATVVGIAYRPGKFLNALRPEASRENEQLELRLEQREPPYRPFLVRQITGAIARRIVCWVKPGEVLSRGQRFGMIKLGSRTELVLPVGPDLRLQVRVGDRVRAGATPLAVCDPADGAVGEGTGSDADSHALH
jgi:phosphatidylserine decarboxylase